MRTRTDSWGWLVLTVVAVLLGAQGPAAAQSPLYQQLWRDTEIEERIAGGIQAHRTGWATIRVVDAQKQPLDNVEIRLEQTTHDFLFGANLFMLDGFNSAEKNRRYETAFTALFNFASAPFYWKTLEPEPGKLRFGKDSPPIFRRPPPDAVVEFCQQHGIVVKGHTLVWDNPEHSMPDWLPPERAAITRLIRNRMQEIAARYNQSIPIWDVVNEALQRHLNVPMPRDYVWQAFQEAARAFPPDTKLLLNEATRFSWLNYLDEETPFYLLAQNLLLRGARIDALGLQCHFFYEGVYEQVLAGKLMQPALMFEQLDLYARLQRPLHITEITIPTLPNTPEGEQAQAAITRNLYRLWFSHPQLEAITWWNLADGTAVGKENKWNAGLLRADLTAKPSYQALDQLINHEWKTRTTLRTEAQGAAKFRGFYGRYTLTLTRAGQPPQRRTIHLSRAGVREFVIQL